MTTPSISHFIKTEFTATVFTGHTITHDVYKLGAGKPIVIIQELPGIGIETLRLAELFVEQGFEVYLPHLFGPLGKTNVVGNLARVFCLRKEFHLFQKNKTSPIVDWLKALCQKIKTDTGAPGVGTIGMCLTGNFAISLMADDSVLAAVSSQPSMPLGSQSDLHMSDADVEAIKHRIDNVAPVYAYRFEKDSMCTAKKFDAVEQAFNNDAHRVNLRTLPGKGHSVLTLDFVDEKNHPTRQALDEIFAYFTKELA
jgi:dienelactone hydrolase